MQQLTQALDWIEQQQQAMSQLLCQWAEINSHTFNLSGVDKMREALAMAFSELDARQEIIPVDPYQAINDHGEIVKYPLGSMLYLQSTNKAAKNILLCGHLDTVYPHNDAFQHVQSLSHTQLRGPGVTDMKSGLVIMLYSLMALQKFQLNPQISWQVVINTDEEIGSPGSTPWIKQCAQNSDLGLVFEPALDRDGTLVSERKGSINYVITAQGKAAHAGRAIASGRNAIVALAEVIQQITLLNNAKPELTINVGQVTGGKAMNIVPDFALCRIGVRYAELADVTWLKEKIDTMLEKIGQKTQVKLICHQQSKRCPKKMTAATMRLLELTRSCGEELQMHLTWQKSGGCCDGNTIALAGIPVIDTLGGCGENIHSPQEKLLIPSLVQRTKLVTLLLTRVLT